VVVQTGASRVAMTPQSSTDNAVTAAVFDGQVHFDGLTPSVADETAGATSLPLGSEANDILAIVSSGAVPGETGVLRTVAAGLVVAGSLELQTKTASGQHFQIGTLPVQNTLLYRNSPGQLASERLFLDLAQRTDVPADRSVDNLWYGAALQRDWLALPINASAAEAWTGFSAAGVDQHATDQQAFSDHRSAADNVFAKLANDMDDFSDFGDY